MGSTDVTFSMSHDDSSGPKTEETTPSHLKNALESEKEAKLTLNAKRCRRYRQRKKINKTMKSTSYTIATPLSKNALYCRRYRKKKKMQLHGSTSSISPLLSTNVQQEAIAETEEESEEVYTYGQRHNVNKVSSTSVTNATSTARSNNSLYCRRYREKKKMQKQGKNSWASGPSWSINEQQDAIVKTEEEIEEADTYRQVKKNVSNTTTSTAPSRNAIYIRRHRERKKKLRQRNTLWITESNENFLPNVKVTQGNSPSSKQWTPPQIEALIDQYKLHPVLYDPHHERHADFEFIKSSLESIVQNLQPVFPSLNDVDVTVQWDDLLSQYLNQNNDGKSSSGQFLEKLRFLDRCTEAPELKIEECEMPVGIFKTENNEEIVHPMNIKQEVEENEEESKDVMFAKYVVTMLAKITNADVKKEAILEIHEILEKAVEKI